MSMTITTQATETAWKETAYAIRCEDYKEAIGCIPGYDALTVSDIKIYNLIKPIFKKPYSEQAAKFIQRLLFTRNNVPDSYALLSQISSQANPSLRAHLILGESEYFELTKPDSMKSNQSQAFVLALFKGIASAQSPGIDTAMIKNASVSNRTKLLVIVNSLLAQEELQTQPEHIVITGIVPFLPRSRL